MNSYCRGRSGRHDDRAARVILLQRTRRGTTAMEESLNSKMPAFYTFPAPHPSVITHLARSLDQLNPHASSPKRFEMHPQKQPFMGIRFEEALSLTRSGLKLPDGETSPRTQRPRWKRHASPLVVETSAVDSTSLRSVIYTPDLLRPMIPPAVPRTARRSYGDATIPSSSPQPQ